MISQQLKNNRGLTFIEILIVVMIIAIVLSAVMVVIGGDKRKATAEDAKRWQDVNIYINAVGAYAVDNQGDIPEYRQDHGHDLPNCDWWLSVQFVHGLHRTTDSDTCEDRCNGAFAL